ncbi:MAG TPA: hypothetical protein VFR86_25760 [Burkholderiaceae bacterium]|nr:hypothetical protein [Burkholderiaceae bacterium]
MADHPPHFFDRVAAAGLGAWTHAGGAARLKEFPRTPNRVLLLTFVPAVAFLLVLIVVSLTNVFPMDHIARDPAAVAQMHPFTGVLSNVGVLLWCAAGVAGLFGGLALRYTPRDDWRRFLVCSGLLSLLLLFDDFFMFHEWLAPHHLGIHEYFVLLFLLGTMGAYLWFFRSVIFTTDCTLLALALGFFGLSFMVDLVPGRWMMHMGQWEYLLDDGPKFIGLAAWCSYHLRIAQHMVIEGQRSRLPGG